METPDPRRHDLLYENVTAHSLVAETAVNMAQEVYETLCSGSNAIYKVHGDRKDFVRRCAPTLRRAARSILAKMLADPNTSEMEREKIYEALLMDNELPTTGTSIIKKGSW